MENQQSMKAAISAQRQHGEESPALCMKEAITTIKNYGKEFTKMFLSKFFKFCVDEFNKFS